MKSKSLFIITISIVLFFSCFNKSTVKEVSLKGHVIKTDLNDGVWAKWMFDDIIYAMDHNFSVFCGKLTRFRWEKTEKALVCGEGENEFGYITLSQDNDRALYVLNHSLQREKLISLTKICRTDNNATFKAPEKWEKYDLGQLPNFLQLGDTFVVLSDSSILVTGAPADDMRHVLSVINFKNQTIVPLDYWPNDGTPENRIEEKWSVYNSGCGINSNGKDKFLYWDDSGKFAFIFTIDGKKINIQNYLYADHLPIPNIEKTPSTERIYCISDNDRIYLLHKNLNSKGQKMKSFNIKDPFQMGNTVEVYDWNGAKQHIIHLDKCGRMIMLSQNSKTLYLYSDYMIDRYDTYIYAYDLGSLK